MNLILEILGLVVLVALVLALVFLFAGTPDLWDIMLAAAKAGVTK